MKNRNRINAEISVTPETYAAMLAGKMSPEGVVGPVVEAMNTTAHERSRRVFGAPRQTDAVEIDGFVVLTYEADTEPA